MKEYARLFIETETFSETMYWTLRDNKTQSFLGFP